MGKRRDFPRDPRMGGSVQPREERVMEVAAKVEAGFYTSGNNLDGVAGILSEYFADSLFGNT